MRKIKSFKSFKLFEADFENEEPGREENTETSTSVNKSKTPFLDSFGKDLCALAADGKLDPVVGRQKEILETSWILCRRKKNNPVLIGDAGVGKTAIVEGLAQLIYNRKSPRALFDKRIVSIDMGSLIAGAKYRGQFEERIKMMVSELEKNKDVILFIDEIHMITTTGGDSGAANMLKPALARGEIQCIGATTLDEYRTSIEKDAALERRFQKIIVEQTTTEQTLEILRNIKSKYEDFHLVNYTDEALETCVKLAEKYMSDRFFPDKAIDLLDEVGAKMHLEIDVPEEIMVMEDKIDEIKNQKKKYVIDGEYEKAAETRTQEKKLIDQLAEARKKYEEDYKINRLEVTADDVKEVVGIKTGIPSEKFSDDEGERLLNMNKELKLSIIGQDQAVEKISKCIKRNRSGLKDPKKPTGVFLFLGPTGVGKTQLVKSLAKYIFGSDDSMIRIDMSEYSQEHNVARMIGAPPGYVGYGEGGQLTEKIRRKPYSVILLDEIEKAHPKIFDIFLQIFDDGILTDGSGRRVNFKNTIIIMTSNIGSKEVKTMRVPVGFGVDEEKIQKDSKAIIKKALNAKFSPEFLNRLDDVIIFNPLEKDSIYKIIDIELSNLSRRLNELKYTLVVTENVKKFLLEKGFDENMGARPLKRAIQRYLEDNISDEILRKNIKDIIKIDYRPDTKELTINGNVVDSSYGLNEKIFTKFSRFQSRVSRRKRKMIKMNDEIHYK